MSRVTSVRNQVEISIAARNPAALSPRIKLEVERIACGATELDELLNGGLPIGAIAELVGVECSGRTTIALAYVATVTQAGSVCAWIDANDSLDPESTAANGVDLERMLWVRCGALKQAKSHFEVETACNSTNAFNTSQTPQTGGGSAHPRSEGRGMPEAISMLLQTHGSLSDRQRRRELKSIGTPGMPNRPLFQRSEDREEQVNSDRLPPRRGNNVAVGPRCVEPQPRRVAKLPSTKQIAPKLCGECLVDIGKRDAKPWTALDQALRSADLLLQSGGFSVVVLDLGSISAEFVWRIPLATWFRFRASCERTRTSLVLLTTHACARSSAESVIRLKVGAMAARNKVMTGFNYNAVRERSRSHPHQADHGRIVPIRKAPQSEGLEQWNSESAWALAK